MDDPLEPSPVALQSREGALLEHRSDRADGRGTETDTPLLEPISLIER